MATKVKTGVIDSSAITSALIANASITADDLHATLDLTGKTVTVATATAGDNDTSVASTSFVSTAIANLADSAPSTLNTLNELAAALGDDANYATTTTNAIAAKLPLAGGTMTGNLTITKASPIIRMTSTGSGNDSELKFATAANGRGIYLDDSDSNKLKIYTGDGKGAAGEFTIDNSGKVGIGITSPSETLHVKRADGTALIVESSNDQNNTGDRIAIEFRTDAAQGIAKIIGGKEGNYQGAGVRSGYLAFQTINANSYAERMRITSAGRVGIGTTAPSNQLHVKGTGHQRIKVEKTDAGGDADISIANRSDGTGWVLFTDAQAGANSGVIKYVHNGDYMSFRTNGTDDRIRIASNGAIGIGVTPEANWRSSVKALDLGATGAFWDGHNYSIFANNIYEHTDTNRKHKQSGFGSSIEQYLGTISFNRTTSGSADATISGSNTMFLNTDGNVGIGTTSPSAHHPDFRSIQLGAGGSGVSGGATGNRNINLSNNTYLASSGSWKYVGADHAANIEMYDGTMHFKVAPSGSADANVSFAEAMTIHNNSQVTTPQNQAFRARATTGQVLASGWKKVGYDSLIQSRGAGNGGYSTSTSRFTALVDGWYQFNAQWTANANSDTDGTFSLWINGSSADLVGSVSMTDTGANHGHVVSGCCYLAATHYVEVYRYSSVSTTTRTSNPYGGWFSGYLIG